MGERLQAFYTLSIQEPEQFWSKEAESIYWHEPFKQVLDYSRPPFAKWFVGGKTNICYNAIDRHLKDRANQAALVFVSTETQQEKIYSFSQLHHEVNVMASIMRELGVKKGDRVVIYMPMIPEALFAMYACTRIGAVHSVVFGGFAAHSLAARIDDAKPQLMITADAGSRGGKVVPYKPLVDEACQKASFPPEHVLIINRGLDPNRTVIKQRDVNYGDIKEKHLNAQVNCEWVDSEHPSYILYTSGTTGKPKGVQRDTGGYLVAMSASIQHIYCGNAGETFFTTSDIGWVVGHSYIVYGPLISGMTTVVYEGLPIRPDPGIWWDVVNKYQVSIMFSSPTAIRVLKKQDPIYLDKNKTRSLRYLFLAGEPLDEPTAQWITQSLNIPVVDNYWQTETGWPILSAMLGVDNTPRKFGSPSFPVYGYNVQLINESTGEPAKDNEKGLLAVIPPLPPGCLSTIWGDDERFVKTYFSTFKDKYIYSTFDWGVRDTDGYYFILGRTDDVINVAGHRLGTREIEEAISSHHNVVEVAVVGVNDPIKGQKPFAFVVSKDNAYAKSKADRTQLENELFQTVDQLLGAIARPARVFFVSILPKTRSGKLLRRSIQALAEGRDPGDLTTLDDPTALESIKESLMQ
ncbi:MAG: propionate--CoA ligase [Ferrovum sp. 37-45-19]|uniref:propionate--CoA ligase n=1 Tax=Ferrovum sp. JA12 TaxID=1356299 RepID=UPI000703BF7B|nr:propionate--CoA ligase [Ferrovum sp. JA12]OYV80291.1 MAG: propionate--CoA ligase [Ferrovum sp. 21-44-67]OYV95037.1 MAG: propionate--CoA ligase [Ferrovum sp. 37-45-19]OZB32207.1 MAG: propionate--CoA ligase [Ferrovum sp. 34-44-207]HQT80907.1 propionate--CoA ligase [Ferrovaceae bacterium]KRH78749.1 acetyl-coenzyme A synthetase [Ferrovum sp. JA12]